MPHPEKGEHPEKDALSILKKGEAMPKFLGKAPSTDPQTEAKLAQAHETLNE
jgi:hypothetical protein